MTVERSQRTGVVVVSVDFRVWTYDVIGVSTPPEVRGPTEYISPWSLGRISLGTIKRSPGTTSVQVPGPTTREASGTRELRSGHDP